MAQLTIIPWNSAEILWQRANSATRLVILRSAKNCDPRKKYVLGPALFLCGRVLHCRRHCQWWYACTVVTVACRCGVSIINAAPRLCGPVTQLQPERLAAAINVHSEHDVQCRWLSTLSGDVQRWSPRRQQLGACCWSYTTRVEYVWRKAFQSSQEAASSARLSTGLSTCCKSFTSVTHLLP